MSGSFSILSPLFGTAPMDAVFSDSQHLQGMLDFEAALAAAQAALGIIPAAAAPVIAAVCRAGDFDTLALAVGAAKAGNTAIPLVKALTARVAAINAEAARWVHWGATSQDALDTGLVLQIRQALPLLRADLDRLAAALARLAEAHAGTLEVGRTWMQHATPVTFGLKAAGWLSALLRVSGRLQAAGAAMQVVQFGGAAGTLASLGADGLRVSEKLAEGLGLALPDMPWHSQRDRVADLGGALALVTGTLGKMARDISLLMQTEIAEVAEPAGEGRGGSSAMPHKRNPVGCAVALAAAARVPPLVATLYAAQVGDHERSLGPWQSEWQTLPEIFRLTAGSLHTMAEVIEGLQVFPTAMASTLATTDGLILAEAVTMTLGGLIGRMQAHHLVERASHKAVAEGIGLKAALLADPEITPHLDAAAIDAVLDPAAYLGEAKTFVTRVLAAWRKHQNGNKD